VVARETITIHLDGDHLQKRLAGKSYECTSVRNLDIKALHEALLKSLQWNEDLVTGAIRSIDALIERDNLNSRQVHRLRKLAFLAPGIMEQPKL